MDETSPGAGRRVVAAGVLAAMIAGLVHVAGREPAPVAEPDAALAPAAEPAAAAVGPAPDPAAVEPAPAVAAEEPGAGSPPAPAPSFDVVRVSPDGSALVAGRASPGSIVTILGDAAPLAEVEADAEGNFVAIFRAQPSDEPQALTLEAADADGGTASSEEVVMLFPEAPAEAGEVAAAPAAGADPAPVAAADGSGAPAGSAATEEPEAAGDGPSIAATAILRPDAVEAAPTGAPSRSVTLASIAYAAEGEVTLAGLGTAGAVLRVYVDDAFAREAAVGADGRWSMELGEVAEGVYRLRIDELAADGRVASRVETPFQRDYPRAPLPRPDGSADTVAGTVTVQPGHNLWTLARLHYGSGVMYTQIFTANREQIRDPDLIYPGQIFAIPETVAE